MRRSATPIDTYLFKIVDLMPRLEDSKPKSRCFESSQAMKSTFYGGIEDYDFFAELYKFFVGSEIRKPA